MTMNEATDQRMRNRAAAQKLRNRCMDIIQYHGEHPDPGDGNLAVWRNDRFEVSMYVQFWLRPKDTACSCGCQMPKKASGKPVALNYVMMVKDSGGNPLLHLTWADKGDKAHNIIVDFNRGPWEAEFLALAP